MSTPRPPGTPPPPRASTPGSAPPSSRGLGPLPVVPPPPTTSRRGQQLRGVEERVKRGARKPTVALGVSGSIAAYKAAEIARLLVKAGVRVVPLLTRAAREFVGPATFSGITGEPVRGDMWEEPGELHVSLAKSIDLLVIAPATADLMSRLAGGRADDLLTALYLCYRGPTLVAPAMHPSMWSHPATARNVAIVREDGRVELVGPDVGEVASGDVGAGRMAGPAEIAGLALNRLGPRDLEPLHVVVTAGPTFEDIDPVRFVGNRSTGKMGFAVAERAARRGAFVTLVAGPVALPTPAGVRRVDVRSALELQAAIERAMGEGFGEADVLVMTAAVADYRSATPSTTKLKRSAAPLELRLEPNPDVLAEVGRRRKGREPVLVGFALETDDDDALVTHALRKLEHKRIDLVVANHADDSLGKDDNRVTLVTSNGAEPLPRCSKLEVADRILDRALALLHR